jgi:N-acylglucosamine-6-phosphate 2-epimerase
MKGATLLESVKGGLIVSVQAEPDSVLNTPEAIALLARCAARNGAVAVRVEGVERLRAVRAAIDLPIVGLIKRRHPGFEPYITSTLEEIDAVAAAGAEIVAFDATGRPRSGAATTAELVCAVKDRGAIAFADCARVADARAAADAGADIVATTLAGYTSQTRGCALPALALVTEIAAFHAFAVCEGGIATVEDARRAFEAGAAAITVGTAITNVDALVARFAAAVPRGGR